MEVQYRFQAADRRSKEVGRNISDVCIVEERKRNEKEDDNEAMLRFFTGGLAGCCCVKEEDEETMWAKPGRSISTSFKRMDEFNKGSGTREVVISFQDDHDREKGGTKDDRGDLGGFSFVSRPEIPPPIVSAFEGFGRNVGVQKQSSQRYQGSGYPNLSNALFPSQPVGSPITCRACSACGRGQAKKVPKILTRNKFGWSRKSTHKADVKNTVNAAAVPQKNCKKPPLYPKSPQASSRTTNSPCAPVTGNARKRLLERSSSMHVQARVASIMPTTNTFSLSLVIVPIVFILCVFALLLAWGVIPGFYFASETQAATSSTHKLSQDYGDAIFESAARLFEETQEVVTEMYRSTFPRRSALRVH